jgi:hypothetical protein
MARPIPEIELLPRDLDYIRASGRDTQTVLSQFNRFIGGFAPMKLVRPVSPDDGLFSVMDEKAYIVLYEQAAIQRRICKFVPASGAASRMFKLLYAYVTDASALSKPEVAKVEFLCENLSQLALYSKLKTSLARAGSDLDQLIQAKEYAAIINHLLHEEGLNYGQMPKALLAFHQYDGFVRTALEEHLVEAVHYSRSAGEKVRIHFTVSELHQEQVETFLKTVLPDYERRYQCTFDATTSIQQSHTDTPAVDLENNPFRDRHGNLLFRPGGHGALLENLNQIDADWVFIKNIDNVVPDRLKSETYHWKKVLGGILADMQQKIFSELDRLDETGAFSEGLRDFMESCLNITFPRGFAQNSEEQQIDFIRGTLNRPIRVCGLIKTTENTGGGPFWVEDQHGSISLQILETPQIDLDNPAQQSIAKQSTYANITDLVCGLKDYKGKPFDLLLFRDDEAGFITQKSLNGKPLKAMELPGLWNGAMAHWNTILVEVPGATFNPVKSIFDLLGPAHME